MKTPIDPKTADRLSQPELWWFRMHDAGFRLPHGAEDVGRRTRRLDQDLARLAKERPKKRRKERTA